MRFGRGVGAVLVVLALLGGCGKAEEPETPAPASTASTALQCENGMRNVGQPDYGLAPGTAPNSDGPVDQAREYVDASNLRRDYPDVEIVVAESEPSSQTIALVSEGKSVGILRYEISARLGWHLTIIETCSPSS